LYPDSPLSSNIELTDDDFKKISTLIYNQCGINLHDGKKELVRARLGKIIREGQFESFRDYYQYVREDESGQELVNLLDSISTNFTNFFREQKHFEYLKNEFLPEILMCKKNQRRRLSFWSAGCSSGEEAYSIVITLLEALEIPSVWTLKVLGTDISTRVLKAAKSGIYGQERVQSIPPALIKKFFLRGDHLWQGFVKVKDEVKQYTSFIRLNLMEPFSFREPFDCIFCRNVMIYFDKKTQTSLVNRFYDSLAKGGIFIIGHSESLTGIQNPFNYVKPAIYKKEK
jgi:chemotaxis protein methyltransferase CheR